MSSLSYIKTLRKKFINYLLPSVVAMWVFSLYTIIDGIFVGKGVGPTALAAVNLSMPFINFIFAISILLSIGSSTVIAIYLGEEKKEKANNIFSLIISFLVLLSVVILVLSYLNLNNIALFLGADITTITYVKQYLGIIIFFNGFFMVAYYLEVLSKTDGFPYLSIIGVAVAALTNIILDYIFVIKLNMGIRGAAFATGLSQALSSIIFIAHFLSSRANIKFTKFKIDLTEIKRIILIGFPDFLTELATGIVILLFNQIILTNIGENGVVAYSVISYVSTFIIMTMIGITQGMQPLTSFYYGKKEKNSVNYILKLSLITIFIISIISFLISYLFTGSIVSVFIDKTNTNLFTFACSVFKIYSFSFIILGFNIIISGFCASIEKPLFATIISISRSVITIIMLILLTNLFGSSFIWISTTLAEFICLLISLLILKKLFSYKLVLNTN